MCESIHVAQVIDAKQTIKSLWPTIWENDSIISKKHKMWLVLFSYGICYCNGWRSDSQKMVSRIAFSSAYGWSLFWVSSKISSIKDWSNVRTYLSYIILILSIKEFAGILKCLLMNTPNTHCRSATDVIFWKNCHSKN